MIALLVTGLLQSWFLIGFFDEPSRLLDTPFGRAALIKFLLLVGPLMALGAYNQRRLVPRLKELAADGTDTRRRTGFALRRSLRVEILLIVGALAATAALTTYAPADYAPTGPVSKTASLGPADLQLTVDPARVGPNEMHVYLIDKQNGTQYDKVKEMNVDLLLPAEKLGPLKADVRKAGPGPLRHERRAVRRVRRMGREDERARVGVRRLLRVRQGEHQVSAEDVAGERGEAAGDIRGDQRRGR